MHTNRWRCLGSWSLLALLAVASCGGGGGGAAPPGNAGGQGVRTKWDLWARSVELRGANVWQARVDVAPYGGVFGPGPYGPALAEQDFRELAATGANLVDVSHPGLYSVKAPYALDPQAQQNLDTLLARIAKADLFAVITMRTGPGRSEFTFHWGNDTTSDPTNGWFPASLYDEDVWKTAAAQDAWVAMWRHIAGRYRSNPVVVAYDLMCEPNGNLTQFGAGDPAQFYPVHANDRADWNRLYPRLVAAIREVDPDTPILVGAMGYSDPEWLPWLQRSSDTKVVYAVHRYEPGEYTHQAIGAGVTYPGKIGGTTFDKAALESLLAPVQDFRTKYGLPVVCNECGLVRWCPNAHGFMDDQLGILERLGAGHAVWDWEPPVPVPDGEHDGFNFRFGPSPTSTSEVPANALYAVYKRYWAKNRYRPSNVRFQ